MTNGALSVPYGRCCSSVSIFRSVHDSEAHTDAHTRTAPSVSSLPKAAIETVPFVKLTTSFTKQHHSNNNDDYNSNNSKTKTDTSSLYLSQLGEKQWPLTTIRKYPNISHFGRTIQFSVKVAVSSQLYSITSSSSGICIC